MADEIVQIVDVSIEDKIAKLKTTLEGMELLGATIPQEIKDAVAQEIATSEENLKAEAEAIKTEVSSSWVKYRVELIIAALLIISHVAGRFGF